MANGRGETQHVRSILRFPGWKVYADSLREARRELWSHENESYKGVQVGIGPGDGLSCRDVWPEPSSFWSGVIDGSRIYDRAVKP